MHFMTFEEAKDLIMSNEELEYFRRHLSFGASGVLEVEKYYETAIKGDPSYYFYGHPEICLLAFKENHFKVNVCGNTITDKKSYFVTELYVAENYRRSGLSREMFKRVFEMFNDADFYVHVNSTNNRGIRAYEKSGFKHDHVVDSRDGFHIISMVRRHPEI